MATATTTQTTQHDAAAAEQEELERVQTSFRLRVANIEVSPATIVLILQYAMEAVEASVLHGLEKRGAVVHLVRRVVVDAPIDDRVEAILVEMIDDGIVGHIIDITVAASRGKLHLNAGLADTDPEVIDIIEHEKQRQRNSLCLIASENFTSQAVLEALGCVSGRRRKRAFGQASPSRFMHVVCLVRLRGAGPAGDCFPGR